MPFNAAGIFERLYSWVTERDNREPIRADRMDAETDNIKDAINAITANEVPQRGPVRGVAGSADAPGYSFEGDLNTGIYQPAANQIGFAVNGTGVLQANAGEVIFSESANVTRNLDVGGTLAVTGAFEVTGETSLAGLTVSGAFEVAGETNLAGLTVTGAFEVAGETSLAGLNVSGAFEVAGETNLAGLNVSGESSMAGLNISGVLAVNGATVLTSAGTIPATAITLSPIAGVAATNVQQVIEDVQANFGILPAAGLQSMQVFATPGTHIWRKPAGIRRIRVYVTGGGGCGERSYRSYIAGPGGGGGGTAIKIIDVSALSQVSMTIGAGGSVSGPVSNRHGGASSFGNYCTGLGGSYWTINRGAGGNATGGDLNIKGGAAVMTTPDSPYSLRFSSAGPGGESFFSPATQSGRAGVKGAGGGGLVAQHGGFNPQPVPYYTAGGDGIIVVEEYA